MDYPDQDYNERFLQSQIDGIKESIIAMNLEKMVGGKAGSKVKFSD